MSRLPVFACLLLVACAHTSHLTPPANAPLGQLPRIVEPAGYDLTLSIDPRHPRFGGEERIALKIHAATDVIWLHGRGLTVKTVKYFSPGGDGIPGHYEQVSDDGVARIRFPVPIDPGDGSLLIAWTAPFDRAATGLYHVRDGGADYVFSQFEAQYARKAFPCFDEPSFKVPFDIKLIVPLAQKAVSNTPIASTWRSYGGGKQLIHFEPTRPLPTYLIAFAVGPLDVVKGPDIPPDGVRTRPIPLRGVATRGKGKLLAYALQHAGAFVQILERYFGIAYPYDKLDLIAVPDFAAGAMENAGTITFKEFLLLMDEAHAPVMQKRAFASVAMHELSHQWFGDLVTMKWWDDIWLNEAFATWMAARSLEEWDPSMQSSLDQLSAAQAAMGDDRLATARAIRQPIRSRDDIDNAFDGITYLKGASVIGMFEHWVGVEKFRRGIHDYLAAHAYGNATSDDFLSAISHAAGRDVGPAFHTFLDQPGVPYLQFRLSCTGPKPTAEFEMSRYAPIGSTVDTKRTWQVPVCLRYGGHNGSQEQCALITSAKQDLTLNTDACPSWLMPNADARGYYDFGLQAPALKQLIDASAQLNEREHLALAHSIQAALGAGRVTYADALSALLTFASSTDFRLLRYPFGALRFAREELVPAETRPRVEAFARRLEGPPVTAEGLSSQDAVLLARTKLGFALAVARDPALRRRAAKAGLSRLAGGQQDPLLSRPSFIDLSLQVAGEDEPGSAFQPLVDRLKTPLDPLLRRELLDAIGRVPEPFAVQARALSLEPEILPSEVFAILYPQALRIETREATWRWIQAHYDDVVKRVPEGGGARLPGMETSFCSEKHADEVERFFAGRMETQTGGPRDLAEAVEEIRLCAAFLKAYRAPASAYFEAASK